MCKFTPKSMATQLPPLLALVYSLLILLQCVAIYVLSASPEITYRHKGAQWLSGRVLDSRPMDRGFEPHRRHCVVS